MKVILKNTSMVFQKGVFHKDIELVGKMTSSDKSTTESRIAGLDPNIYYVLNMPKTLWACMNWTSSYWIQVLGEIQEPYKKLLSSAETPNINYLNLYSNKVLVSGVSGLTIVVRADKGEVVRFSLDEVNATIPTEPTFVKDLNLTQGQGVYGFKFAYPEDGCYKVEFDTSYIKTFSDVSVGNDYAAKFNKTYAFVNPDYLLKSEIGAGNVINTGATQVKFYKVEFTPVG